MAVRFYIRVKGRSLPLTTQVADAW